MEIEPTWITATVAFVAASVAFVAWRSKQALDQRAAALQFSLTKNPEYLAARRHAIAFIKSFDGNVRLSKILEADALAVKAYLPGSDKQDGRNIANDIRYIFAHWEVMSISVMCGCVDEEVCYEMVGETLVQMVDELRQFIDFVRSHEKIPRRYDYLLILQHHWKEGRAKRAKRAWALMKPRRPIDNGSRFLQYEGMNHSLDRFRRSLFW